VMCCCHAHAAVVHMLLLCVHFLAPGLIMMHDPCIMQVPVPWV
jgi:hypothetical protein